MNASSRWLRAGVLALALAGLTLIAGCTGPGASGAPAGGSAAPASAAPASNPGGYGY